GLHHNGGTKDSVLSRYAPHSSGIAQLGQTQVGWGIAFLDPDHQGSEDLFMSNGHASRLPAGKVRRSQYPCCCATKAIAPTTPRASRAETTSSGSTETR